MPGGDHPQVIVAEASRLAAEDPSGGATRTLLDRPGLLALLIDLAPGRELAPHTPGSDLILAVLDGAAQLLAGGRLHRVRAGDVAVVPAGEPRGVRCLEGRLIALGVVSPPPGADDHRPPPQGTGWPEEIEGPDPAQLIRDEHAVLLAGLAELDRVAETTPELDPGELVAALLEAVEFMKQELLPHAAAEERLIYPAVERELRAGADATRSMALDHVRIWELTEELERVVTTPPAALDRARAERTLVGLLAVVHLHLDKEEQDYLPRLSRISPGERDSLVRALAGEVEAGIGG